MAADGGGVNCRPGADSLQRQEGRRREKEDIPFLGRGQQAVGNETAALDMPVLEAKLKRLLSGGGGHIAVKKKAMACIAEFGRGNFEAPLEKFPGKKVFINDTIEQVRANLKSLIFYENKNV